MDEEVPNRPNETCQQAVDRIVSTIRDAYVAAGVGDKNGFVTEGDVVRYVQIMSGFW